MKHSALSGRLTYSSQSAQVTHAGRVFSARCGLTAITDGMYHPSMKAKMDTLEAERERLEAALGASSEHEPVALHPGLAGIYAGKVSNLAEALNEEGTRAEAADLLRGLIENVTLHSDPDTVHGHRIVPFGELAVILSLCDGGLATKAKARSWATGVRQVTLVAGTGFGLHRTSTKLREVCLSPATFRL